MRSCISRAFAASTVLAIVGLAACGSDEPKAASSATAGTNAATSAGVTAFCEAHLALTRAASRSSSAEVDFEALAGDLVATAPAEIATTVESFVEVMGRAAASGDDAMFVSDQFRGPTRAMEGYVAKNCGHQVVEVTTIEFGFEGVPASLESGPTMFHFVNEGEQIHEGILFRRAEGVAGDPIDLLSADPSAESGTLDEVGVALVGEAGDEYYLTVDLEPGAYVLVCFFPQGAKTIADVWAADGAEDATHDHRSAGMVVGFEVKR